MGVVVVVVMVWWWCGVCSVVACLAHPGSEQRAGSGGCACGCSDGGGGVCGLLGAPLCDSGGLVVVCVCLAHPGVW